MKKTFNINIAGEPFIIDEDAYTLLSEYLDSLHHAFAKSPDGQILQADIESRIAELFSEELNVGSKIIDINLVRTVIEQIGQPQEFIEDQTDGTTPPPPPQDSENTNSLPGQGPAKRLYRDPQDKILGGVCSGISHYFGIDPVWIRIAFVLIFFLSYSSIFLVYLLLWVIIPLADTPYKRMLMYGKPITIQGIGNAFAEHRTNEGRNESGSNGNNTASNVFGILAKIFMVILSLIALPMMIVFGGLLTAAIASIFSLPLRTEIIESMSYNIYDLDFPDFGVAPIVAMISLGIVGLIVCGAIIWCTISMFAKQFTMSKGWRNSLLITFLIAFTTLGVTSCIILYQGEKLERQHELQLKNHKGTYYDIDDMHDLDPEERYMIQKQRELDSVEQRVDSLSNRIMVLTDSLVSTSIKAATSSVKKR